MKVQQLEADLTAGNVFTWTGKSGEIQATPANPIAVRFIRLGWPREAQALRTRGGTVTVRRKGKRKPIFEVRVGEDSARLPDGWDWDARSVHGLSFEYPIVVRWKADAPKDPAPSFEVGVRQTLPAALKSLLCGIFGDSEWRVGTHYCSIDKTTDGVIVDGRIVRIALIGGYCPSMQLRHLEELSRLLRTKDIGFDIECVEPDYAENSYTYEMAIVAQNVRFK